MKCPVKHTCIVGDAKDNWVGVILTFLLAKMTKDAHQFMMIVTYSTQLMEMNSLSELSFKCKSFCFTRFSGKERCHQNFEAIEYPPHVSRELLPTIDVVGVLRIRCAIGLSNLIPESGLSASAMKFNLLRMVLFTR